MRPTRLLSTTIVVGVTAVATFFACGGDDGGGNGNADAPVSSDAKVFLDAPPTTTGIGTPCTPSADGSGQGTCEAGYTCLKLGSAAPAWCSKTCTRGGGDQCDVGYTGPGVANCMWDISFGSAGGSGSAIQYCGVICAGTTACSGSNSGCDGTCPGQMTCTQPIGTGSNSGSACK